MTEKLSLALQLKELTRSGWVRCGVTGPESVAAHSWGVAWLVLLFCPPELDREKALALATVHDLAEVVVGDLTPHDPVSSQEKACREREAMKTLAADLPRGDEIRDLHREYQDQNSAEAQFVRACDKLDMALQALRYEQLEPLDLEEFLQSAEGALGDFPELKALISRA